MLPTCLAKPWTKAFSVVVLVSASELANSASIALGDLGGVLRVVDAHDVPADHVRAPKLWASSK